METGSMDAPKEDTFDELLLTEPISLSKMQKY